MGYFDDSSSDDDSDYDSEVESSRPKIATNKTTTTAVRKARSFLDDSDSDDSDDDDSDGEIDFDDSFLGDFRRKQQQQQKGKDLLGSKGKQPMMDSTEKTHYAEDLSGDIEYEHDEESEEEESEDEESEDEQSSEEEHVFRETTTDWMETMQRLRQHTSRKKRGALEVRFVDVIVTDRLEYCQHDDAVLSVNDANHRAQDHDEIPWYEQDYQELPWWEQPDLEEDDALTALCKRVLAAGEAGEENRRHIERVEANVLGFALKLKSRAKISS